MTGIVWEDIHSVGIREFDRDHLIIVNLINKLQDACAGDKAHDAMDAVLRAIAAQMDNHFRREEDMMARHGYPGLAAHRAAHRELAQKVADFRRRSDAIDEGIAGDFLAFLHERWSSHIMEMDMAYKAFFQEAKLDGRADAASRTTS